MKRPEIRNFIITEAQPERAYDAWTEPEHLSRWFCDKVTGWPGYGSKLNMTWERFGFSIEYNLPTVQPPRKVILKALIPGMGTQTLDISIRPYGAGSRIEIVETGPGADGQEGAGDAKSGWEMSLSVLKLYIEKYWGKPRKSFFALVSAPYENKQLMELYQSEEGLAKWLTSKGSIGNAGDPVSLELMSGDKLTGKVMAVTSHELVVSWDEIAGYLELKSFEVNSDRKAVCIRGFSYGGKLSDEDCKRLEGEMENALGRLSMILSMQ